MPFPIKDKNIKRVYSDYLEDFIPAGFVRKYSASDYCYIGKEHYTWNEEDLVYYSDDEDGKMYWLEDIYEPYISWMKGMRVDFIFDTYKN